MYAVGLPSSSGRITVSSLLLSSFGRSWLYALARSKELRKRCLLLLTLSTCAGPSRKMH